MGLPEPFDTEDDKYRAIAILAAIRDEFCVPLSEDARGASAAETWLTAGEVVDQVGRDVFGDDWEQIAESLGRRGSESDPN